MQKLEILEAYTITAAGIRQDVAPTKIYTQESYSSASAAMYADYKVKVVVFPNLAPGARGVSPPADSAHPLLPRLFRILGDIQCIYPV